MTVEVDPIVKAVDSWYRAVSKALTEGKGKYAYYCAKDLHDYLHIIELIRAWSPGKAYDFAESLDTHISDDVPKKIWQFIENSKGMK